LQPRLQPENKHINVRTPVLGVGLTVFEGLPEEADQVHFQMSLKPPEWRGPFRVLMISTVGISLSGVLKLMLCDAILEENVGSSDTSSGK
jgi:hypothetical protein